MIPGSISESTVQILPATRQTLTPDLNVLSCESEPVHAPGAIQNHGALLVALADGLLVSHVSANLDQILWCPPRLALGRTLEEAIGKENCRLLLQDIALAPVGSISTIVSPGPQGGRLQFRAHRTGRHICVDIEQVPIGAPQGTPIIKLEEILKTFDHAATGVELCGLAVNALKKISGYDRVMAYRFIEAGHGEVIAEAREAHLEAYLGLRYPASDIPPQARRLYLRQRVGSIANSAATPVPLIADPTLDDGAPIDLTHSTLRSVSPIHRAYMRNMNTAASLTIGLAQAEELWGMLVCHHGTARVASSELRAAAGAIGVVVSLLLASLNEAAASAERIARDKILRSLTESMAGAKSVHEALASAGGDLLRLVNASGLFLCLSGKQMFIGSTPAPAAAASALVTLQSLVRSDVLAIDDLGLRFPDLAACTDQGSGALLLQLATSKDDALLWFRPEEARGVTWGGDPHGNGPVDPLTKRESPRSSFEPWEDTVKGSSAPWMDIDLALAHELGAAVQVESAKRTQVELRETQARLGLLAEHSGVVLILSDIDGTRRYVSPAAESVLGWHAEDLVGRNALEFIHPDDRQTLLDANNEMMKGEGRSSATYRFRRPDGSWLWVDGHARLRTNVNGQGLQDYVVVMRDATERKLAEVSMSQLNRVYAMLSNINTLIVHVRDRDRIFSEACGIAISSGRFRMAAIGMVDEKTESIQLVASAGATEELNAELRRLLSTRKLTSSTMVARAVTSRTVLLSNDSQNDPQVPLGKEYSHLGVRSMAFLPLLVRDEAVGVLALYAGETDFFHEDEMKLLTRLASDIAFAIDHIDQGRRL